ncbi:MAG TPA: Uma2 family endonuclease [Gemmataceae bacterium]|jgi:hypothetical protein|nr:Uma2 family endonuclease [Gemmataceae bacterium]
MTIKTKKTETLNRENSPDYLGRLPILYEDDEEGDLGESNPHVVSDEVLHICLMAHFAASAEIQVFSNMNFYYLDPKATTLRPLPYVSPDTMVVKPYQRLPENISSYQIGRDGPAPVAVVEILSERSAQQRDLEEKVTLYAALGIEEYLLVDVSGKFLSQKLLLKRLQSNGTWQDKRDNDGGITSTLGFRLQIDPAGRLVVLNADSGKAYVRPAEAENRVRGAEKRAQDLEGEIVRLRQLLHEKQNP